MKPKFSLKDGAFVIENYNQARPFSSFLPGIAGLFGKPMWVFYTNRGQCISSFGVRNKNSAMLEFYPANKAYTATPLLGFRTFLRFRRKCPLGWVDLHPSDHAVVPCGIAGISARRAVVRLPTRPQDGGFRGRLTLSSSTYPSDLSAASRFG